MEFNAERTLRGLALTALAAGTVLVGGVGSLPEARAADVEVYFSGVGADTTNPNILFVLDTSQSMFSVETDLPTEAYDPAVVYDALAGCDKDKVYWATVGGLTPRCTDASTLGIKDSNFQCNAWKAAVNSKGFQTGLPGGPVPSKVAQSSGSKWTVLDQQDKPTACNGDTGNSGPGAWGPIKSGSYTFYDGNYLNYLASGGGSSKYRIDLVREVVGRLVETTAGVNIGLMRFGYDGDRVYTANTDGVNICQVLPDPIEDSRGGRGAPIVYPVADVEGPGLPGFTGSTVREQIRYELGLKADGSVESWVVNPSIAIGQQPQKVVAGGGNTCPIPLFTPGGRSPIGGAMREAYFYYSGQDWSLPYGRQAALGSTFGYPSVWQSRVGCANANCDNSQYRSPITDGCQKNFIILLSDGTTEQDNSVDLSIAGLPGFADIMRSNKCDPDPYLDVNGTPPPSQCVDDMAQYMFESDLRPNISGIQNVTTYTVGFKLGADAAANSARQLLKETAQRGGGLFYEAQNATQLEGILVELVRQILVDNTSFTAPAVAVNAFNRTENLDDLYISLFRPALSYRWRGNVKKYKLESDPNSAFEIGTILDSTGSPAVNPATGFFRDSARSFWTDTAVFDGGDITLGGAQAEIDYSSRDVYTNLTGDTGVLLTQAANAITAVKSLGNATKRALLGYQPGDALDADQLVDWLRGMDVNDIDGDSIVNENRYNFGDPLHSRPALSIYGGTAANPDLTDAVLFVTTNDGYLQAIDPTTGAERWAFVPRNLLPRTRDLALNPFRVPEDRSYGLDGTIRLVQVDNNSNGIIETSDGDKVYLFFGQRRGGFWYYGMDVTSKDAPRLMWAINPTQLPGLGQTWSTPEPTRINIDGVVTPVLIIGGGYDLTQDQIPYAEDTVGNRIFMIHALTGARLWSAGPTGSGATLELADMKNSIPSAVIPVDLTDDGLADRFYASDTGGRVFRFDVVNGKTVAGSQGDRLIEGGLFASLGNAADLIKDPTNTIRFFSAPDLSIQEIGGVRFINIALGSGHRSFPASDTTTRNWFFALRDYRVRGVLPADQYKASCAAETDPCHEILDENDLVDLTSIVGSAATALVGPGSPGWKIALEVTGEKSLGESVTLQGTLIFTTYAPESLGRTDDSCAVRFGVNRVYAVSAVDARPANNRDGDYTEETDDRSELLASTGTVAPPPTVVFPPAPVDCVGPECRPRPVAYCGLEICGSGFPGPPVRTFWRQRGAE